jgi:hypothetical protein
MITPFPTGKIVPQPFDPTAPEPSPPGAPLRDNPVHSEESGRPWYCRYGISDRDLEQMMAERGVSVDHSTIYRWVQRYAAEIEKRLRWHWRRPRSRTWRVDETYVKVRGKWSYL